MVSNYYAMPRAMHEYLNSHRLCNGSVLNESVVPGDTRDWTKEFRRLDPLPLPHAAEAGAYEGKSSTKNDIFALPALSLYGISDAVSLCDTHLHNRNQGPNPPARQGSHGIMPPKGSEKNAGQGGKAGRGAKATAAPKKDKGGKVPAVVIPPPPVVEDGNDEAAVEKSAREGRPAGKGKGKGKSKGKVLTVEDAYGDDGEEDAGKAMARVGKVGRRKKGLGIVAAAAAGDDDYDDDDVPRAPGAMRKQRLDARLAKKAEIDRAGVKAGVGGAKNQRGRVEDADDDAAQDDVDVDVAPPPPPKKKKKARKAGGGSGRGNGAGGEGGEDAGAVDVPAVASATVRRAKKKSGKEKEVVTGSNEQGSPAPRAPAPALVIEYKHEDELAGERGELSKALPPTYPEDIDWTAAGPDLLGAGGFGAAYLWRGTTQEGTIVERIVVKDCHVSANLEQKIWHWVGDPRDFAGRQHVEIACMEKLRAVPGGQDYTVALRHAEVDRARRWYRLYMAYCPHGSLHELIKEYLPRRSWLLEEDGMERCEHCGEEHMTHSQPSGIEEKDAEEDKYGERFVPEPFLWYVFEALARTCIAMENIPMGSGEDEDEDDGPAAAKQCIIHRDLKPANIFLDAPDNAGGGKDKYPSYPRPRVGDFGISLLTSATDPFNPLSYMIGEGTPNWIAPETQPLVDNATGEYADLGRIDGKANVWGIGAILGALISRETKLQGTEYEEGEDRLPKIQLPVFTDRKRSKAGRKLYSTALLDLVNACLAYRPAKRPSADQLLEEILSRTDFGEGEKGNTRVYDGDGIGNDKARRVGVPEGREKDPLLWLDFQNDAYPGLDGRAEEEKEEE
ncbi:hypothetical protein LTR86_006968 [Recurvomyces mirabilis]|nr:hypothetical protein LTR86_006968 [Recurvomyces mirabilis]